MAFVMIGTIQYQSSNDRERSLPIVKAHRERCLRDEPGTIQFDVLTVNDDDTKLMLYEVYENSEAFDAHWNGESIKQTMAEIEALGIKVTITGVGCARQHD